MGTGGAVVLSWRGACPEPPTVWAPTHLPRHPHLTLLFSCGDLALARGAPACRPLDAGPPLPPPVLFRTLGSRLHGAS